MGLLSNLKMLWSAKGVLNQATKETKMEDGAVKPGILTSEFWGKNIVQLIILYNAFAGGHQIDPTVALEMVTAIEGLYHGLRAAIKIGKDIANAWKAKAITTAATQELPSPAVVVTQTQK